ncbi:MAG: response regulator [Marinomonas sp.]
MIREVSALNKKKDLNHFVKLLVSLFCFVSITGFGLYSYTLYLSEELTQKSALNSASIYTRALKKIRSLYSSEVVDAASKHGMLVTHDYDKQDGAIPLPATFSMLIGKQIGAQSDASSKLYSPYPFPSREDAGGLKGEFAKKAWSYLQANPDRAYSEFFELDGEPVLKYATADVMTESCLACHNSHPDSPQKSWQVGDVRGILEVTLPLNKIIEYSNNSLLGVFWLLFSISILGVLSVSFFVIRMKKDAIKLEQSALIKESLNGLNDAMSGEQNISQMSQSILGYLAPILGAQQGALFLAREDQAYTLTGSYALSRGESAKQKYEKGEGLVGQVIADKKVLIVRDVPENYLILDSGLGTSEPKMIVLYPILFEGELLAVMELASLGSFTDQQFEFLKDIALIVGIALKTTISREKTDELLILNQFQVLELKAQQEELGVVNSDLEAQAQQLRSSEEELKASEEELIQQSEQLRLSNVELEEKQESLTIQAQELMISKKELEESALELTQASKYKSEFLANMSHELRTPLNSLLILSKILAENKRGNLTSDQVEEASIIHKSGQSLLELINDIMDLSKVEAGMLDICIETTSLNGICHSLESLFMPISKDRNIGFSIALDPALSDQIQTDQKRVEQVLKNFLSNAFKFTKQGEVKLDIGSTELEGSPAVIFSVTDTGIGIPLSKQKLVFESFKQANGSTNREFGGTGLGLSISKELSQLLKGEIRLKSEEGQGSCFALIIPYTLEEKVQLIADENPPLEGLVSEPIYQVSSTWFDDDRDNLKPSDKSLLIVEDDQTFTKVLIEYARSIDFNVIATNKGTEGLLLAKQYKPNGILLDIGLPDADGLEILETLKANPDTCDIPVHVLSASDNKVASMHLGAVNYLQKPMEIDKIGDLLQGTSEQAEASLTQILLVDDDKDAQVAIQHLVDNSEVGLTCVSNAEEAFEQIDKKRFDCIILDLGLPDVSGMDLVKAVSHKVADFKTPIIIYTGKELSPEEQKVLQNLSISIVIKGSESPERLLDDVALFLNHIDGSHSPTQPEKLKMLHDENSMLEGRRVLVVDDDMRNVFAITRVLEETGLIITQAENGQAAVDAVTHADEVFDLILMDIMMPVMDGLEAMQIIRGMPDYQSIPIIALTAKAMPGDRQKCLDAGGSEYLIKPLDMDMLLSILRVWLYQPSMV